MNVYLTEDNIIKTNDGPEDTELVGGIGNVYFNRMKRQGKKIAQIEAKTGKSDTFASLLRKCVRTAIGMQQRGIKRNDVVVTFMDVQLNGCVPYIASFFIGAIPNAVDKHIPLHEIKYLLKQVKPKLIFIDADKLELTKQLMENCGITSDIAILNEESEFLQPQKGEDEFKPVYIERMSDTAALFFSSGTTGLPKCLCLNHYIFTPDYSEFWRESTDDNKPYVILTFDSFYWFLEATTLISSLSNGYIRLLQDRFDVGEIWENIDKYKVNAISMVPFELLAICKFGKPKHIDASSLTTIVSTGAHLPEKYISSMESLLPRVHIFQIYGQTEIGAITRFSPRSPEEKELMKAGSVGRPFLISGTSIRIVDRSTGENLGPNKEGELYMKRNTAINGYYNSDSSDRFDENDDDLHFYVTGRLKDVLYYQGWPVAPLIIETELLKHPDVEKVVVIGKPHAEDGEHPMALVVLKEKNAAISPRELEIFYESTLPDTRYKLSGGLKIIDEILTTGSGKVKRMELAKLYT